MPFLHCSWLPPLPYCPRDVARLRQSPTPLCAPRCSSHVRKPPGQRVLRTGTATARWSWFSRKAVLPLARHSWCLQAESEHPRWPKKVHENLFCIIIWLRSQIQYLLLQPRVFRLINRVFQGVPSASLYKVQYCCLRKAECEQDTPGQHRSCPTRHQFPSPRICPHLHKQTRHQSNR